MFEWSNVRYGAPVGGIDFHRRSPFLVSRPRHIATMAIGQQSEPTADASQQFHIDRSRVYVGTAQHVWLQDARAIYLSILGGGNNRWHLSGLPHRLCTFKSSSAFASEETREKSPGRASVIDLSDGQRVIARIPM